MEQFINMVLASGKKGVELVLFIILPIMVLMMAFMRVLDEKGVLRRIALWVSPLLLIFGLPGLGVFAMLQILLVSFAAPVSSLVLLENDLAIQKRKIASTLAMILTMSQANAVFPLVTVGLNLYIIWLSSITGGLLAAVLTYYFFANKNQYKDGSSADDLKIEAETPQKRKILQIIMQGGEEGIQIALKALPMIIIAILVVNILKHVGFIEFLGKNLSPIMGVVGVRGEAILPIVTKFLAGGTAMMGVTLDMVKDGTITALEINKIAGFMIHPFDIVGIAVYVGSGKRTHEVLKPALIGAAIGILFRGIMHLIIF